MSRGKHLLTEWKYICALCRADVEKQRMNSNIKRQQMDDSKNEYANQLQKTNELQVSVRESE